LRAIYHLVLIIIISVGASVSQETDEVFRPTATQTPAAEGSSPIGLRRFLKSLILKTMGNLD